MQAEKPLLTISRILAISWLLNNQMNIICLKVRHCVKSIQIRSFLWSVFSRIRTEYGELRIKSPY